jgi:class III poly(R)-hydroxyalkanoic acid synthase PhaE subunit
MNQWQAMSRQYLNAWAEMARGPEARPAFGSPVWPQGFEQMAKVFPGGGQVKNGTIEHLVDSAKTYAAFMQSMLGATMQGNATPDWGDALRKGFASMGGGAAMPAGAFDNPMMRQWQGMGGQGNDVFAQMRHAMGNLQMPSAKGLGDFKSMLEMPAFGLMREHQERQQKSIVAWIDYQEQTARYNALMVKASQRGFELFEGKLLEREQPGRQIDSMRALYDLWVDAAEEGYAEIALSHEFREVYGAMVNAQMRVRSQVQQDVERMAADFGMPTRSEINSIGERLQALRREVRERVAGEGLADEVAALRAEVAALKAVSTREPRSTVVESSQPTARASSRPAPAARRSGATVEAKIVARPSPVRVVEDIKPVERKRPSRKAAAAVSAAPVASRKRKEGKRGKGKQKAVAAMATGSFASRIEKFATASRGPGNPRKNWKMAEKTVDPKKKPGH